MLAGKLLHARYAHVDSTNTSHVPPPLLPLHIYIIQAPTGVQWIKCVTTNVSADVRDSDRVTPQASSISTPSSQSVHSSITQWFQNTQSLRHLSEGCFTVMSDRKAPHSFLQWWNSSFYLTGFPCKVTKQTVLHPPHATLVQCPQEVSNWVITCFTPPS